MSGTRRQALPANERQLRQERAEMEAARTPFADMTIEELRKRAKQYGVPKYGGLKKERLVDLVAAAWQRRQG